MECHELNVLCTCCCAVRLNFLVSKLCISKHAVKFYWACRNLFLTDINQDPCFSQRCLCHIFFELSTFFNQKCLSALNNKQRVTFSVTQGRQTESKLKMGCKSKSARDYSRENDDLVMETIKGKPELVCKPRCIITLLKKSPVCNLKMLSNTRNVSWTFYLFITNFQQAVNKEKSSPFSFSKTNYNKNLFLQALCILFFSCFFFNQTKTKAKTVRVGRREITMLLFETQTFLLLLVA